VLITFGGVGLNVLLSLLLIAPWFWRPGRRKHHRHARRDGADGVAGGKAVGRAGMAATRVDGAPLGAGDRGDGAAADLVGRSLEQRPAILFGALGLIVGAAVYLG